MYQKSTNSLDDNPGSILKQDCELTNKIVDFENFTLRKPLFLKEMFY